MNWLGLLSSALGFLLLAPFFALLCWIRFLSSPRTPRFNLQLSGLSQFAALLASMLGSELSKNAVTPDSVSALWPQIVGAMSALGAFSAVFFFGWWLTPAQR